MDLIHSSLSRRQAGPRHPVPLLPGERTILRPRKHPVVLIWSMSTTLVALLLLGWLSNYVAASALSNHIAAGALSKYIENNLGLVLLGIWLVWGFIFLSMVYKTFAWATSRLVITDRRLILTRDRIVHRCASVQISKVTSWFLRDSLGGLLFGYKSLVFRVDSDYKAVRTIERITPAAVRSIEEVLPSAARNAYDEGAFKAWAPGGLRRFRLTVAVLLFILLVILGVAAAMVPRIQATLDKQAVIFGLLSIVITVITLITPKS